MRRHTITDCYGLRDWASGVRCIYAAFISLYTVKIEFFTYITVVTTSSVFAGTVAAGVGGATHLVQMVEVYVL